MSPKEKAIKLVDEFKSYANTFEYCTKGNKHNAKQCALIAVDEIILQNGELYLSALGKKTIQFYILKNNFLFEVKKEIELL